MAYSAEDYPLSSSCSVDCAASILLDHITSITMEWIVSQGHSAGSVIRIGIKCSVDVEGGASISSSFLSQLSRNALVQPDTERVLFVSRIGDVGVLGYGCCIRADSIHSVRALSAVMCDEILMVGGDSFTKEEDTKCRGWLVPAVEVRTGSSSLSSSSQSPTDQCELDWPHATLALNILIPHSNDLTALQLQLSTIKVLLTNVQWDFRCSMNNLCEVPPLVGEVKHTGMSEAEYTAAVERSMRDMAAGDLKKVVFALRKTGITQCAINPAALLLAVANGNRSDDGKRYTFLFAPQGLREDVFLSLSPEQVIFAFHNTDL